MSCLRARLPPADLPSFQVPSHPPPINYSTWWIVVSYIYLTTGSDACYGARSSDLCNMSYSPLTTGTDTWAKQGRSPSRLLPLPLRPSPLCPPHVSKLLTASRFWAPRSYCRDSRATATRRKAWKRQAGARHPHRSQRPIPVQVLRPPSPSVHLEAQHVFQC